MDTLLWWSVYVFECDDRVIKFGVFCSFKHNGDLTRPQVVLCFICFVCMWECQLRHSKSIGHQSLHRDRLCVCCAVPVDISHIESYTFPKCMQWYDRSSSAGARNTIAFWFHGQTKHIYIRSGFTLFYSFNDLINLIVRTFRIFRMNTGISMQQNTKNETY